jgi:hypothetical protein
MRDANLRFVTCGTGFLEALMSARAFEGAVRPGEMGAATEIAGAEDELNEIANRNRDDPLGGRRQGIGWEGLFAQSRAGYMDGCGASIAKMRRAECD